MFNQYLAVNAYEYTTMTDDDDDDDDERDDFSKLA